MPHRDCGVLWQAASQSVTQTESKQLTLMYTQIESKLLIQMQVLLLYDGQAGHGK